MPGIMCVFSVDVRCTAEIFYINSSRCSHIIFTIMEIVNVIWNTKLFWMESGGISWSYGDDFEKHFCIW